MSDQSFCHAAGLPTFERLATLNYAFSLVVLMLLIYPVIIVFVFAEQVPRTLKQKRRTEQEENDL